MTKIVQEFIYRWYQKTVFDSNEIKCTIVHAYALGPVLLNQENQLG